MSDGGIGKEDSVTDREPEASPERILSCLDLDVAAVADRMKARPRRGGARVKARRRREAERLLGELMRMREQERGDALQEERFQRRDLFELLLEQVHAALPFDVPQANVLVTLASGLGVLLNERHDAEPDFEGEGLCRALCLAGTTRRLSGLFQVAEAAFERAGTLAVSASAYGFFCRAFAMLRWDQGRNEEAAALLHQAQRRFAEGQALEEAAACFALLGLLHLEEGDPWRAAPLLVRAARDLNGDSRPWLVAQCWLGQAFTFAVSGESDKARSARRMAWRFGGKVKEEEALVSLQWLDGRVVAFTEETEEAGNILDLVRRKLLARRLLPEATLATIDLGLVRIADGRGEEVSPLIEELAGVFAGQPEFDLALGALRSYVEDVEAGRVERDLWNCVAPVLRVTFRLQGVWLRPVPFM